jgi:hypothetical protein
MATKVAATDPRQRIAAKPVRVQEGMPTFQSGPLDIDEATCSIRGVKICGLQGRNAFKRRYPIQVLEACAKEYEGKLINVDHVENGKTYRRFDDRFAWAEGVHTKSDGLYGTLRYNPEHPKAKQFLWWAKNNPGAIGLSHDAILEQSPELDGTITVHKIVRVIGIDLVADPSTTNGLHEAIEMDPTVTTTDTAATASDTAGSGSSTQSLRDHITQMVQEKIGSIEDAEMLRKVSSKIEKFLAKLGTAGGDDAEEEETPVETKSEQEAIAALRASNDPHVRVLLGRIDQVQVQEAVAVERATNRAACKSAGLPDLAITETFLDSLAGRDATARAAAIADRKALLSRSSPATSVARESIERVAPGAPQAAPGVDDLVKAMHGNW